MRPTEAAPAPRAVHPVLEVIIILLLVAWLLGVISGVTFDGQIYLLLPVVAAAVALRLAVERREQ